jgi:hypothetical protein
MTYDVKIIEKFLRKSAWIATIALLGWQKSIKIKLGEISSVKTK